MLKRFGVIALVAIGSLPLAVIVTLVCAPFWRWFEETTGIEAYGHMGPGDWCYELTYGLLIVILLPVFWYLTRNKQSVPDVKDNGEN